VPVNSKVGVEVENSCKSAVFRISSGGSPLGLAEGEIDGDRDGLLLGERDGLLLGEREGLLEGEAEETESLKTIEQTPLLGSGDAENVQDIVTLPLPVVMKY
jgi:hypothetical protein